MEKKVMFAILICLIFANSIVSAELILKELRKDDKMFFESNFTDYEVSLDYISSKGIRLDINGNVTIEILHEGDVLDLNNSAYSLQILDVDGDAWTYDNRIARILVGEFEILNGTIYEEGYDFLTFTNDSYNLSVASASSDKIRLDVDGEITSLIGEWGSYKLMDGSLILVTDILTQGYENGTDFVEFYFIKDKNLINYPDVCAESDGGKNILSKGVVSLMGDRKSDSCLNNSVVEYYCSPNIEGQNQSILKEEISCPSGSLCVKGECFNPQETIEKPKTVTTSVVSGNESVNNSGTVVGGEFCAQGCIVDEKCIALGFRNYTEYCSSNGSFVPQLKGSSQCTNDYECESNVCTENQCINKGLFAAIVKFFRWIFG